MLRFRATLLYFALFCAPWASVQASQYTFTRIADNSQKFRNFGPHAINATGTVAFQAENQSGSWKILSSNGLALTRVGRTSTPSRRSLSINENGRVAYLGVFPGGAGIFTGRGGPVRTIVRAPSPNFARLRVPQINNQGQVCFRGQLPNGGVGIFLIDREGALTTVAREGDSEFQFLKLPVVNNNGTVAFIATRGFRSSGIFITGDTKATPVVLAPEDGFTELAEVALSDTGTIAFRGDSDGVLGAVYVASGGEYRHVGEDIGLFGEPISINDSNNVAFTTRADEGVAIARPPEYQPERVIGRGDVLFDSTVSFVYLHPSALNNAGQIVFSYLLDNGRQGIAVATPSSSASGGSQ